MNSLKQRIIGALVLISLAVIFLPMLFDRPHKNRESQIISIPVKPEKPEVDFEAVETPSYQILDEKGDEVQEVITPNRVDVEEKVVSEKESPDPSTSNNVSSASPSSSSTHQVKKLIVEPMEKISEKEKVASIAPPSVAAPKQHAPEVKQLDLFKKGILIQVGTFSSKENALKLRKKLIDMGLDGHVSIFKNTEGKTLWQVFSGPYVNKQRALKDKSVIDKAFKVKSFIKQF